ALLCLRSDLTSRLRGLVDQVTKVGADDGDGSEGSGANDGAVFEVPADHQFAQRLVQIEHRAGVEVPAGDELLDVAARVGALRPVVGADPDRGDVVRRGDVAVQRLVHGDISDR